MVSKEYSLSRSALPSAGEALLDWQRCWLFVSYDGSGFHGSQYQSQGRGLGAVVLPTVQGAIRQALEALGVGADRVKVHCASRTDAGVHAMGQVVQLTYAPQALAQIQDLQLALNHRLPPNLAVWACQWDVPLTVCCQHSAKVRWYRYRLNPRPYRCVWGAATPAWRVGKPLNVAAMQMAAEALVGRHDCTAFASPHTPARDPWCHLKAVCVWHDESTGQVVVDIAADRFLYKMVRNLVAALVTLGVSTPSDPAGQMASWLKQRCRQSVPHHSAPAEGLMLMAIEYQTANFSPFEGSFPSVPQELLNKGFFSEHVYVKLLRTVLTLENSQHENIFRQAR